MRDKISQILYAIGTWFHYLACAAEGHRWRIVTSKSVYCSNCDTSMSEAKARAYFQQMYPSYMEEEQCQPRQ